MNRKEYIFDTVRSNRLQLVKINSKNFQLPLQSPWVFRPSKYDVEIKWHGFNDLDQLLLLDSSAVLTLYCLKTQAILNEIKLYTEFHLTAHSDAIKNRLYIYTDRSVEGENKYKKYIYVVDSMNFTVLYDETVELEYDCVDKSYEYHQISQYYKNKLYIAYQDENTDDEVEDGYVIVNLQDKTIEKHLFDKTSYSYNFGDGCRIWFAPWFDLGLRPHYKNIRHIKSGDIECFTYSVDVFILSTGELLKTIPVREIQSDHLGYGGSDKIAHLIRDADINNEDYHEAHDDFFEDLNHVVWEKEDQAFWVLFRGGILRRIDIQGKRSPLIVSQDLRKNSSSQDVLSQFYEHSHLLAIDENNEIKFGSVSYNYDSLISFNPSDYDLNNETEIIDLVQGNVVDINNEQNHSYDSLSINIIKIDKWDLPSCIKVLQILYGLVRDDMDALLVSERIKICYELPDEKFSDAEFYKRLIPFGSEIAVHIEPLIALFIQNEKSERYYHDEETTFLFYAIESLIKIDESYIDLFCHYIASVDMDHDVSNASLIYDIFKTENWTQLKTMLAFLCHSDAGSSNTHDMLSECWEKDGLKEFVNNNYTADSLNELYKTIFNITNGSFDADDIISRLEEFEGYSENSVLIECFKNM
ncbi:hypothetical protein MNBD_GAMMA10-371 [hydrothermal vent metagenome]|uniref:Uncharacterized protein n=1 Tax=hydrothermal vent metagenome TaxID=652676 RepID=A0A3B0XXP9_9ZZZZ